MGIHKKWKKNRGSRGGKKRKGISQGQIVIIGNGSRKTRKLQDGVNKKNLIKIQVKRQHYCLPKIMYSNIRSLNNKLDDLLVLMRRHSPDIVLITETWIKEESIPCFNVKEYSFIHRARSDIDKTKGGGVGIYLKNNINILDTKKCQISEIEAITIMFRLKYLPRCVPWFAVLLIYYPPQDKNKYTMIKYIQSEIDRLFSINCKANIFVIGDFNDLPTQFIKNIEGFKQIISLPTRGQNLIDLCFTNTSCLFAVNILPPLANSDHNFIELVPEQQFPSDNQKEMILYRSRSLSNMNSMCKELQSIDWQFIVDMKSIDDSTELFYEIILEVFDRCFPEKQKMISKNSCVWYSEGIGLLIDERDKLFTKKEYDKMQMVNVKIKKEIIDAKSNYFKSVMLKAKKNNKVFYKVIKDLTNTNGKKNKSEVILHGMSTNQSNQAIADFFMGLTNKYEPLDMKSQPAFLPDFPLPEILEHEIYKELIKIKDSATKAPDNIPGFVFSQFALELAYPVTLLINRSIELGLCPERWKKTKLIVFPKTDVVKTPEMLRPISISSPIVKICEKFILHRLMDEITHKIDLFQFGGVKGRNSEMYLLLYLDYVLRALDKPKSSATCIVVDYKKAFDHLDHNIVIHQLCKLGVSGNLILWISSFLTSRKQIVKITYDVEQIAFSCSNGVPQGSVLGAALFIIIINDISISSPYRLKYIDDLTVIGIEPNQYGVTPQELMTIIVEDSKKMKLPLNKEKSHILFYSNSSSLILPSVRIDDYELDSVQSIRLLGITVQVNLKWNMHINNILKSSFTGFKMMYRMRRLGADRSTLKLIYIVFIRSKLEYACSAWNHSITNAQREQIEQIQKRACKLIIGKDYSGYESALDILELQSLNTRRDALFLKSSRKFYKFAPFRFPETNFEVSGRQTRKCSLIQNQRIRTERYKRSAIPKMIEALNNCDLNI